MRKIPKEAEGVVLSPSQKVRNFWYYNKWICLFLAALTVIISVSVYSCANRVNYDCTVVVALSTEITDTTVESLTEELLPYCDDYNGDGEVNLNIYNCSFTDNNVNSTNSHYTNFVTSFQEPENMVFIIDQTKIDFVDDDSFMDNNLNLPDLNGKAFNLNNTEFGKNCLKNHSFSLPENTYLVRRSYAGTITKKSSAKTHFDNAAKFINAFVNSQK